MITATNSLARGQNGSDGITQGHTHDHIFTATNSPDTGQKGSAGITQGHPHQRVITGSPKHSQERSKRERQDATGEHETIIHTLQSIQMFLQHWGPSVQSLTP